MYTVGIENQSELNINFTMVKYMYSFRSFTLLHTSVTGTQSHVLL